MYSNKKINITLSADDILKASEIGKLTISNTHCYTTTIGTISIPEPKVLRPKICACCNAPLRADKCEYCGVEYG